jgi:hypothetical protein
MEKLPQVLDWSKVSFHSRWNSSVINFAETYKPEREIFFGYVRHGGENDESRVVSVIKSTERLSIETRSTFWQISEIKCERHSDWIIFSRIQNDLSNDALLDFVSDSRNFLKHLRDEDKRLNTVDT